MGDSADQPLTDQTTTIEASKLGGEGRFIKECKALLIDPGLRPAPGLSQFLDIRAVLFRSMGGLFLKADPLTSEEAVNTTLADLDLMVSQTLAQGSGLADQQPA